MNKTVATTLVSTLVTAILMVLLSRVLNFSSIPSSPSSPSSSSPSPSSPSSSSLQSSPTPYNAANLVSVSADPSIRSLVAGVSNVGHVEFRIQTDYPPDDQDGSSGSSSGNTETQALPTSPPLELVVVLDKSGSMAGDLLSFSKQAIVHLMTKLKPSDVLHLIAYNDRVSHVYSGAPVPPQAMEAMLRSIHAGGGTNLFAGVEQAYSMLSRSAKVTHTKRILLFSDGEANVGITDHHHIFQEVGRMVQTGVTFSTFGVGNHFDTVLMRGIADAGLGDFHFIATAPAIPSIVRRSMQSLVSVVGTNAVLQLQGFHGLRITEVAGQKGVDFAAGVPVFDLRAGDNRKLVVSVDITPTANQPVPPTLTWQLRFKPTSRTTVDEEVVLSGSVPFDNVKVQENVEARYYWRKYHPDKNSDPIRDQLKAGNVEQAAQLKREQLDKFRQLKQTYGGSIDSTTTTLIDQSIQEGERLLQEMAKDPSKAVQLHEYENYRAERGSQLESEYDPEEAAFA